jgi:ABC-type methionine transport system permease subunit
MHQDSTMADTFVAVWVLLWLFFTFFFYYLMVFTIAVTCALWYYKVEGKNPIVTAYKWIFKSAFGSITFAALLISIVTFARMIVDSKRQKGTKNVAAAICLAIIACLLR